MGKPTPEELAKLRDAIAWQAERGEDVSALGNIHDIGVAQAARDDPPADGEA